MIDRLLSLASTVQSNKGAYAVLAGSGVSRAAGIPTGYEVMLDLIRRIARAEGAHCEPDPEAWFQATYGVSPAYPTLLDALAASDVERQQLLRGYFEPTDEERGRGIKLPTYAHRAIAGLMAQGYVRVVVTTNFDRLFEQALAERGITPTVVSTPDQVEGIQPLPHVRQLLIKVHGDYLDTRMKNTPEELEGFDPRLEALVQRVFEEFGLVICGWSAEYDTALRRSLERCSARWFGVYWATRGKATPTVSRLTEQCRARLITIRDADSFFVQLLDKVVALEEDGAESPQSVEVDVARIKKYLSDERYRIELADLVRGEVKRTILVLNDERISPDGELPTRESFPTKMGQYERAAPASLAGQHRGHREPASGALPLARLPSGSPLLRGGNRRRRRGAIRDARVPHDLSSFQRREWEGTSRGLGRPCGHDPRNVDGIRDGDASHARREAIQPPPAQDSAITARRRGFRPTRLRCGLRPLRVPQRIDLLLPREQRLFTAPGLRPPHATGQIRVARCRPGGADLASGTRDRGAAR
ncbi:MAG: hypothetical protein E6K78_07510 [Candidatus Eisenbacteria bacterium]|uniref:Uncharacterized protein n=1 Tax=Eiseniibacteriota bacterium TaxID=2212470 RepID=A0A538TP96_UNCEI|nr:MAG: hypothetical protein E6K78_07510 [Candidatus Eisenbacteria bacterium]